ncbi:beta-lactamase family protein [Alphaproteobacteria bacterium]|nr:beta-lactamase family protein [Alphaproteobacteria bacterium]
MQINATPASQGFDENRLNHLKDWMQRYVDDQVFPGSSIVISRGGKKVFAHKTGFIDIEAQKPLEYDSLARIYSMSKPIVSVALMTFYERGLIHLDQPLSDFIPEFANPEVLIEGATAIDQTRPAISEPTLHHLFTHTSGLTYGFNGGLLGDIYEERDYNFMPSQESLEFAAKKLAELPLLFEPGERWNYSVSTDILGRVLEVVSGKPLDQALQEIIFDPLEMNETSFGVKAKDRERFANLYGPHRDGGMRLLDHASQSQYLSEKVKTFSGGGGLISTLSDYRSFAEFLRRGSLGETSSILAPRTIKHMTANQLPGDIASMGPATFSETPFTGVGYGLLGWSTLDPVLARISGSHGDYGWGGMASTFFWVDPKEDLSVVFFTQLAPSSATTSRRELRALIYQALA